MPITRAEYLRRRRAGCLLASLALVLVGGCSAADDSGSTDRGRRRDLPPAGAADSPHQAAPELGAGRDVSGSLTRLLDRRAAAVRAADGDAFRAGLAGNAAFRAGQDQWFTNVAQLPVRSFGYTLDPASLVRDGRGYWGTVEVSLRLDEYDARPVVTRDRYRFERAGGRFVLASVTDRAWEHDNPAAAQPWDLEPVDIREGKGVLGVFDTGSVDRADAVVAAVEQGIAAMAPRIPLPWDRRVVVYALARPTFLSSMAGVPGGDPLAIDGLTFPVMARPGLTRVASTRFVLNPRLLGATAQNGGGAARDRLIRHELVHVALGSRDDRIPAWLSEGLAEYLSVRTLPPSERVIAGEALDAARAGLTELPATDTFNEADSLANYGVSWWVCEAIAETYGEQMLWTLVEELDGADDPDSELERLLGVSGRRLARDAGTQMLATYEEPARVRPAGGRRSRPR